MLLDFTTRRMVRSAHRALSPFRFAAQFHFDVSDRHSYEKIHTASLGMARWAHLSTRHQIKPPPKGSGLIWWLVLRWAHVDFPTMLYAYNLTIRLVVKLYKANSMSARRACEFEKSVWVREERVSARIACECKKCVWVRDERVSARRACKCEKNVWVQEERVSARRACEWEKSVWVRE